MMLPPSSSDVARFIPPTPVSEAYLDHRFNYHAPQEGQAVRYEMIRATIRDAAKGCVLTPCCPEQTRALNALDEAMFLFNAAIARHG
jgi:hypothetical protein